MGSMTSCISIHAPARGATVSELTALNKNDVFQSTLPRGERQASCGNFALSNIDFNPRSCEGSDVVIDGIAKVHFISIHAPARGATSLSRLI